MFAALADPTRREIARLLSELGPLTQTELAGQLPVTRQAVAKHLRALAEAGLVEPAREGRESRYRLTPAPFEAAALWMAALGAEWDRRLEALQSLLERPASDPPELAELRKAAPVEAPADEARDRHGVGWDE